MRKKNCILDHFKFNKLEVAYFFLGVGLTMFLLNISSVLIIMQLYEIGYPLTSYIVSVMSSIFLITYSLYSIYEEF